MLNRESEINRKLEAKRLFLYVAFAFLFAWILMFAFILTGHQWNGENPRLEAFLGLGMMAPFLAHLLTRWITKEGFRFTGKGSMMLGISFKDKKWKYFMIAMLLPWLYFELGYGITILALPEAFDPEYYKVFEIDKKVILIMPIAGIISSTIASFAAFGEEGGWRGYMMPKLIELVGIRKAVFIGGIIWGLWHAPLTCVGHNFGTDYPGFPYLGILIMCIDCTFMGITLTYVMVKSGSIWPAAIMHAVNNVNPSILKFYFNAEKADALMPNPILGWVFLLIPNIIIGMICLVLLCRKDKILSFPIFRPSE